MGAFLLRSAALVLAALVLLFVVGPTTTTVVHAFETLSRTAAIRARSTVLSMSSSSKSLSGAVAGVAPSSSVAYAQALAASTALRLAACINAARASIGQTASKATEWYLRRLDVAPLLTKSATSAVIGWIGDYGAQWFEHGMLKNRRKLRRREDAVFGGANSRSGAAIVKAERRIRTGGGVVVSASGRQGLSAFWHHLSIHGQYDARRGLAMFADGLLVSGPLMHWGYDLFEKVLPVASGSGKAGGSSSSIAALSHVVADAILLDSIFVGTAMATTGLLEGYSFWDKIVPEFRAEYGPTLRASWVTSGVLMPVEFMCFRCLPVRLRTLSVNLIDVLWDGVVSFMAHRSRR